MSSTHRRMPVFPARVCPRFQREGEAGECGFVHNCNAWECMEYAACRHRVHPGQDGYDELTKYDAAMTEMSRAASMEPVPMRIPCPACGTIHVDKGRFATHPHHTHACQACGMVWRPGIGPTVGVQFLPGFKDEQGELGEPCDDMFDEDGPACRVCGCTENHACAGGCGWVREPKKQAEERSAPICTYCEQLVDKAYERIQNGPDHGLEWKTLLADVAMLDEGDKERAAKVILELLMRGRVDAQFEPIKSRRRRRA